jgi:hypothetical protein
MSRSARLGLGLLAWLHLRKHYLPQVVGLAPSGPTQGASGGPWIINTWTSGGGKAWESYMPVSRGSTPP